MPAYLTALATELIPIPGFTDPVSSLTHLLGAVVALIAGIPLVRRGMRARDLPGSERHTLRVVSLVVFVASAVFLLSMSGVYHLLAHGAPGRAVLQKLDHAGIFVLIAGTATPVHAILFRGRWRWGMLTLLWVIAAAGVTLKSIYFSSMPGTLGALLYVAMGWLAGVCMVVLWRRHGPAFMLPLLVGGVVYTAGAIIAVNEPRPLVRAVFRSHELFHVFVLGGLLFQWRFIWSIADWTGFTPQAPDANEPRTEAHDSR